MPAHDSPTWNPTQHTRAVSAMRLLNQVQRRVSPNYSVRSIAERRRATNVCDKGEHARSAKGPQLIQPCHATSSLEPRDVIGGILGCNELTTTATGSGPRIAVSGRDPPTRRYLIFLLGLSSERRAFSARFLPDSNARRPFLSRRRGMRSATRSRNGRARPKSCALVRHRTKRNKRPRRQRLPLRLRGTQPYQV